jgi:hypothetical protein
MSRAFTPPDTLSQDDIRTVADVRRAVWINGLFGLGAGSVTGMVGHLVLQSLQRRYVGDCNNNSDHLTTAANSAESKKSSTTTKAPTQKINHTTFLYKLLRPLPPLTKNTFLLSLLSGGALGSFLFSTTAGKNSVHLLHPIFNVGKEEYAGKSPYQIVISKAAASSSSQEQSEERSRLAADDDETESLLTAAINQDELDIQHHKQRTLRRKASIQRRLESGYSLSDTHSTYAHYNHPISTTNNNTTTQEEEEMMMKEEKRNRRTEAFRRRQTDRRMWVQEKIERGGGISNSTGGNWVEEEE